MSDPFKVVAHLNHLIFDSRSGDAHTIESIKQDLRISANESQPVLDPTSFINNLVDGDMDHVLESDSHSDTNLGEEENSDDDTIGIQILEGPRGKKCHNSQSSGDADGLFDFDKFLENLCKLISDLPDSEYIDGVILYEKSGVDQYGLQKWVCLCGTNKVEGGPHGDIYRKFGALHAGPQLTVNCLTDYRTWYNLQAYAKHLFGIDWTYHHDLSLISRTSFLLNYMSDFINGAQSYVEWINGDLYKRTEKFGICAFPESLRLWLDISPYKLDASLKLNENIPPEVRWFTSSGSLITPSASTSLPDYASNSTMDIVSTSVPQQVGPYFDMDPAPTWGTNDEAITTERMVIDSSCPIPEPDPQTAGQTQQSKADYNQAVETLAKQQKEGGSWLKLIMFGSFAHVTAVQQRVAQSHVFLVGSHQGVEALTKGQNV
ncbi:hypothetical protein ARMGADRAFT_1028532 [Armillaria gallica]|uniref:Uncharacterized protein n=1 Tax=Armillaria gallica TaxID=47427 RepID=A0A2H3DIR0_ARMGA|nr:hypothetical protein ARMGADRAFT_1028532 [Armillaria gallica]